MADQPTDNSQIDNTHFNKLFWYCAIFSFFGISFLMLLCFVPVPKSAERFADNVQGFIEGSVVTACIAFLLGGNIPLFKKSSPTVTNTGDSPVVNVATVDEKS